MINAAPIIPEDPMPGNCDPIEWSNRLSPTLTHTLELCCSIALAIERARAGTREGVDLRSATHGLRELLGHAHQLAVELAHDAAAEARG